MEEEEGGEVKSLLAAVDTYEQEGHPHGKAYSLDARMLSLRCVLHLQLGDKDHRALGRTQALERASSLLGVFTTSMKEWIQSLREGKQLGKEKRGRPPCLHGISALSAKRVGKLRLWVLQRAGRQKGKPNLKVKDVVNHVRQQWRLKISKEDMRKLMKKMGFQWGKGRKKDIIMVVHEREDVMAARENFLEFLQQAELAGTVMLFGDGVTVLRTTT